MTATAFGFTRPHGRDPAEYASTAPPPCIRANASAIWLRFAVLDAHEQHPLRLGS